MMDAIRAFVQTLLPFEFLQFDFMVNALLAILLLTPLLGLLGTMAVNQQMAFFSDALGHSALTGIAIGVVLGWQSQMSAMLLFGLIWAVLITFVKHHSKMSADTIISVFSSTSIALGLVVLSRGGAFAKYSSVLVGDVLSVAQGDLLALLLALVGTIVCWVFLFNPLLITSVNAPLAQSRQNRRFFAFQIFNFVYARSSICLQSLPRNSSSVMVTVSSPITPSRNASPWRTKWTTSSIPRTTPRK